MRKSIFTTVLLSVAACVAQAQDVTLRVHSYFPPSGAAITKGLQPFCDKIAAASKNRMKCQVFPAMQLGGTPQDLYSQVEGGFVDIAFLTPGYSPGRFPVSEVFDLPFMYSTAEQGARAAWDIYEKYGQKEWSSVKPLMFSPSDPPQLHLKGKPINTIDDLKGLKVRSPSRLSGRMLSMFGAIPVGMPATQVGEALSKGVVDGALFPWEGVPSFKLQEMVKYHSVTDPSSPGLYNAMAALIMNKTKYESLPADLKAVIDQNSGMVLSTHFGRAWDEAGAEGRKVALAHGNVINVIPAAELDRWIKAAVPLQAEWVESLGKRGLPGATILQETRDLIAKYKK